LQRLVLIIHGLNVFIYLKTLSEFFSERQSKPIAAY